MIHESGDLVAYLASSRDRAASPLAALVAEANRNAVQAARARAECWIPAQALDLVDQYFELPRVCRWTGTARPEVSSAELFADLCSTPRTVAIGEKAVGLEVEVRSSGSLAEIGDLGDALETGSNLLLLDPDRLRSVAALNGSVEFRQFDRHCPVWSTLVDDLAAVAGADLFVKLFVAGGHESVNGWHQDRSDVIVAVLSGTKRFAISSVGDETGDHPIVDELLWPGDVALLPRGHPHCATPSGELSALMSIGLMRVADWPFRGVPPSHLGFRGYPRSADLYRRCLRAHTLPTRSSRVDSTSRLQTRIPGGLDLFHHVGGRATFGAAGRFYVSDERDFVLLATIHADPCVLAGRAAELANISPREAGTILTGLLHHGLIRLVPGDPSIDTSD